jgi:hypothetical protein
MVFVWCLLGGLICFFAPPSLTGKLQLAYVDVFSWPLGGDRGFSLAAEGVPALQAINRAGDEEPATEHQRLENHIDNLEAQLREAHGQIDHLGRLRAVPQWDRMGFLLADVTIPSQTRDVLFINRGREDGVAVGQYVLGDMSVIGTISDVLAQSARVKLITDPTSKLPVTVGESDLARIMEGRPGNTAKIPLVPATHKVRQGDKVYARKVPGLLDAPIVAARITLCRKDPDDPSLLEIAVQPVCDIAVLTSVAVIVPAPQQH